MNHIMLKLTKWLENVNFLVLVSNCFYLFTLFSSYLLLFVDGQTGTGHRELHDEHHEQDDHVLRFAVKEQQQQQIETYACEV